MYPAIRYKSEKEETKTSIPDPVMLSRQIDGLREVMRRMRSSQSPSVEALINKKLEQITQT